MDVREFKRRPGVSGGGKRSEKTQGLKQSMRFFGHIFRRGGGRGDKWTSIGESGY